MHVPVCHQHYKGTGLQTPWEEHTFAWSAFLDIHHTLMNNYHLHFLSGSSTVKSQSIKKVLFPKNFLSTLSKVQCKKQASEGSN